MWERISVVSWNSVVDAAVFWTFHPRRISARIVEQTVFSKFPFVRRLHSRARDVRSRGSHQVVLGTRFITHEKRLTRHSVAKVGVLVLEGFRGNCCCDLGYDGLSVGVTHRCLLIEPFPEVCGWKGWRGARCVCVFLAEWSFQRRLHGRSFVVTQVFFARRPTVHTLSEVTRTCAMTLRTRAHHAQPPVFLFFFFSVFSLFHPCCLP